MIYEKVVIGTFIARPNRFTAHVKIDKKMETVHVKNTGRCKEILVAGAKVYLEDHSANMKNRKTRYSLVAAEKPHYLQRQENLLINIDSLAPNKVIKKALMDGSLVLPGFEKGFTLIRPEKTFGKSRFDFYVEGNANQKAYIEVKGVTLEDRGVARFPDAPTDRGVKHIYELIEATENGFMTYIIFLVQMHGVEYFEPNDATHPAFGKALRKAFDKKVNILAYDSLVGVDTLELNNPVEVRLG
ncbi:MAG: DNA/RNA nuclease SfsA [Anaerovoracaceae bacterium]